MNPSRKRRALCAGLLAVIAGGFAVAVAAAPDDVTARPALLIEHARARPTPPGSTVAAVYLRIVNAGAADRLLRLSSPVAEQVKLHESSQRAGVMHMRQLPFLDVPAHGSVEAVPGAVHVMLTGLKAPLVNGDHFTLTLVFGVAGTLTTNVSVRADP